jgi:hypothetical protein
VGAKIMNLTDEELLTIYNRLEDFSKDRLKSILIGSLLVIFNDNVDKVLDYVEKKHNED